jgi:glutathione S-transferase
MGSGGFFFVPDFDCSGLELPDLSMPVSLRFGSTREVSMRLIGMLDSPYVCRCAISFQLLGLPLEHLSLSVFRTYDEFKGINPVVKAPSLVCEDGEVLMDSTLILDYAEGIAGSGRSLMAKSGAERQHALRVIGLGLAACEKSVQIVYERNLRPAEKQHEPWVARVSGQLSAAYDELEAEINRRPPAATSAAIGQAGVTTAVAWKFTQMMIPEIVPAATYPGLAAYSARCERLTEFAAAPHGPDTYRPSRAAS